MNGATNAESFSFMRTHQTEKNPKRKCDEVSRAKSSLAFHFAERKLDHRHWKHNFRFFYSLSFSLSPYLCLLLSIFALVFSHAQLKSFNFCLINQTSIDRHE